MFDELGAEVGKPIYEFLPVVHGRRVSEARTNAEIGIGREWRLAAPGCRHRREEGIVERRLLNFDL